VPRKPLYFEIFTTSLGALLLEISYTRIFSFKVFYYFTYLIIGLGLLGVGCGGIAVATSARIRKASPERVIPIASFAGGLSVLVSYLLIAPVQLNIADKTTGVNEIADLVFVALLLTVSFFAVGLVLSTILSRDPERAQKLYAADLLGAALGCTLAVPFIWTLTPPRTVVLSGLIIALGGLRLARETKWLLGCGVAAVAVLLVPVATGLGLRDPVVAKSKQYEDYRNGKLVLYSKWSPVFRIDVAKHPLDPDNLFLVFHDGQPGSGIRRFDGSFDRFQYLNTDPRALPFKVLPPHPKVLIIGAAGGHEVVASLFFDAGHVTGVELNPATYGLLKTVFANLTGHLTENPRVTLLNGDGRWFMKQTKEKYDLVWFVAPDSYAAMNAATSGAFVLSESYLYTQEMIAESLRHLTDQGIICTQFGELAYDRKPNRTTRYITTARAAFADLGIADFPSHVMVSSAPGFPPFRELAVLLGKSAFTEAQAEAFIDKSHEIKDGVVHYVPGTPPQPTPLSKVIQLPDPELSQFLANYAYQIGPVRDDVPFFWHFARFRDALAAKVQGSVVDHEDSIAEQVTIAFLGVVVVLAALLLLLPFVTIRDAFREMPLKGTSSVYFAALGLGFMFIEVAVIQKLTLLLGYPTYALSVTLFGLLVSSGIGSYLSSRYEGPRSRLLMGAIGGLAAVVLLAITALPSLIDAFVGQALAVRIFVAMCFIAPAGLCLGIFMPLGLRTVSRISPRSHEYVAWVWAINGFFSVIASILSTILAMVVGFRILLLVALAIYLVGALAISRLPEAKAGEVA
jgi:predicted membrane-bound spermidine synthase